MTEDQAQGWLQANFDISGEAWERLSTFVSFLRLEAASQNLIAASTLESVWNRHVVDSAQLLKLLPDDASTDSSWIDLGSGAGFPGIVVAILSDYRVTLVESRNRRIDYLQRAIGMLGLEKQVTLAGMPLERLETAPYSVISARAFAPLPRLFNLASRFSTDTTNWVLPKGRNVVKEWEDVQSDWGGTFRIEPSVTDADSGILVGQLSAKRQKAR